LITRCANCVARIHYAELLAFFRDNAHRRNANAFVNSLRRLFSLKITIASASKTVSYMFVSFVGKAPSSRFKVQG
jgi:hypothetical protein